MTTKQLTELQEEIKVQAEEFAKEAKGIFDLKGWQWWMNGKDRTPSQQEILEFALYLSDQVIREVTTWDLSKDEVMTTSHSSGRIIVTLTKWAGRHNIDLDDIFLLDISSYD